MRCKLFSLLFALFCCVSIFAQNRAEILLEKLLHGGNSNYVFVVSHRGDWRNAPENSLQAIERCIHMGVDIVELDVRISKDSVLVLMHDQTIDRTTTGKGKVSDYTLAELKEFRLKDGLGAKLHRQQIPTLEEALLLCKGKILINVDKSENYMDKVRRLLKETGCESQVIYKGGKNYSEVEKQYGKLLEQIIYMPIISDKKNDFETYIGDFIRLYKPVAFEVLLSSEDSPMIQQIDKMRKNGCRVWINSLWPEMNAGHDDESAVLDPEKAWGWLIEKGATIIQTDRPKELLNYLEGKKLHNRN